MIHEISLLNRLLADLTAIQSISSKSYANPHIVGKANPTPKTPIKKIYIYFWEDLFIIGGGAYLIIGGRDYVSSGPFVTGNAMGLDPRVLRKLAP